MVDASDTRLLLTPVEQLRPYGQNARTHSQDQIEQITNSILEFGFTNPVLIDRDGVILAGHARVKAAKIIGMTEVPTLCLTELDAAKRRAYVVADNKLALNAGWDCEILASELKAIDTEFDVELTGFTLAEVDLIIAEPKDTRAATKGRKKLADPVSPIVSRAGDEWVLGEHRLLCGATEALSDQILRFFEQTTSQQATLAEDGLSFSAVGKLRRVETSR
jgi:ParB-like chromosome segregation protein Spo0J